ncbi:MAG: OmpA family protein [Candidatus Krumholzibacteria bacterium]|nr:OmpA family protein [Candidatus Krumholzibacteria bacterium]
MLAVAGLTLFASAARPAIPPAGQVITSRSLARYQAGGQFLSVYSNEISYSVLALRGPLVTPDGTTGAPSSTVFAFAGQSATFTFTLTNAGNVEDAFDVHLEFPAPSDFFPSKSSVFYDVDRNGVIALDEAAVTEVGPLAPGEDAQLIVKATLPASLMGGEIAHINLVAVSRSDASAVDADNVVRVVARVEAQVALALDADRTDAMPGDTIAFAASFTNTGERAAGDVVIPSFIDLNGMSEGTEYVPGSAASTAGGGIEYYDGTVQAWTATAPSPNRVKGVRLGLDSLAAGAWGTFSFRVRVNDDRIEGDLHERAAADYTGGNGVSYSLESNDVAVRVGRVSLIAIGPRGNPSAAAGNIDDRVVVTLGGSSDSCTLWHEILNEGNFDDSVRVALVDSASVPAAWQIDFVDSAGAALPREGSFRAMAGMIRRGMSFVVGLRISSTNGGLRRFAGRELSFAVEAASTIHPEASDRVDDIVVKANIPVVSIEQSIREPTAQVGDVLSFIITVENVIEETSIDSVVVVEHLCPGLGYAGGSVEPTIGGGVLTWNVGSLAAGEKREIVFRAIVKAGQETGRLASSAWVSGVTDAGDGVSDGPAWASVLIVEGVFTRRGILSGAVFEDANSNGIRDGGERGVRGASVFIEDGTYAVTDSFGLYSIPGVDEGRHVVRVDPASIPDSLAAGSAGYFGMGVSGDALIDLAPSGHRRVDFALVRSIDSHAKIAPPVGTSGGSSENPAGGNAAAGFSDLARETGENAAATASPDSVQSYEAITLSSTHFEAGLAAIEAIPLSQIATLSLWINDHPGWKLLIAGHTDSIPIASAEYPSNLELSIARARSVFQMFRMNGISEDRMDYTGFGSRMSVASNATAEGRALNRRVEIHAVPPAGYSGGDPGLPAILSQSEAEEYSLADTTGVCADIVKPEEGSVFYSRGEIDVEIISPLGSEAELYVNDVSIDKARIGLKRIDGANNTFGSIFYGVKLAEGKNDILVVCREYGGKRNACVRHVYLAGRPQMIVPEHEVVTAPADGKTAPEMVFLVSDKNGLPVRDGIFATVSGPEDLVARLDVNPQQQGVQVATAGGRVALSLPPLRESRTERLHVELEGTSAVCRVVYETPLRNWFLFGYGEGELGYSSLSGTPLAQRVIEKQHDGAFAEGKLAFYGQGEIASGHVLTCAVDTRPLREDALFSRIEPEKYYPIYGDASGLKFNAASRSGTFLRLDHRKYGLMLGDFRTDLGKAEFTGYRRSFNGVTGEARFARSNVRGFITRTDQVTYQEEIGADGTSGFYFLKHYPLVENSEKIRIEVRDRYRSERIVRVDYKQINRDYDINYMDGSILFKEPVSAFDEDLNPVTIVVSYECGGSGGRNFIYGVRSSSSVTDSLTFGATAVVEEEGVENYSLFGFDLSGRVRRGLGVESEFAHSEKFAVGGGNAFNVLLKGDADTDVRWNAYYRDVDKSFFNSSFSGGKTELGSRKAGGELAWSLNPVFGLSAKAYRHSFREQDETKDYLDVVGRYRAGSLETKAGVVAAGHDDAKDGARSSILMLTGLALKGSKMAGELQWDQIVSGEDVDEYPSRLQAKLSRRIWHDVAMTFKHEYRTGVRSGTRHLTQIGFESNITEGLQVYSRYQLEGAASGERGEATMGIKNRFVLADDLTATIAVEKVATVSGARTDDYLSIATGALYTPKEGGYRLKEDYEIRVEPDRMKHLASLAALKRLTERWSVLAKGDLWFSDEKIEDNRVKGNSTLGISLRPRCAEKLTILSLVQSRYEKNSPAYPAAVNRELLTSIEANCALSALMELEAKLAARWVDNSFMGYSTGSSAYMYQTQAIRTIAERWDVALKARVVRQCETATTSYGGGVELGRLVARNVRVSAGYDFGGYDDPDPATEGFTRNGFHVGLQLKFEEKIMSYFYGGAEEEK